MPMWPARLLYSNPATGPGTPPGSSRSPQYVDDSDDDSDDNDAGYFSSIPPPHRYDAVPSFTDGPSSASAAAIPTRGHARSMSDKLPAIFGGPGAGRRRNAVPLSADPIARSVPNVQDIHLRFNGSPQHPKASLARDEEQEKSGNCATCASKVRWPAIATEFRCTTCQMINDLRPRPRKDSSPQPPPPRAGTYPGPAQSSLVERTTAIIDRCVKAYLDSVQSSFGTTQKTTPTTPPHSPTRHLAASPVDLDTSKQNTTFFSSTPPDDTTSPITRRLATRSPRDVPVPSTQPVAKTIPRKPVASSLASLPVKPTRNPPPPPVDPTPPPAQTQSDDLRGRVATRAPARPSHASEHLLASDIPTKSIFKPLEEYIVRSFGDRDCLNASFSRYRPRPSRAARSEDDTRLSKPSPPPAPSAEPSYNLSEVDAKTLLLGDVAENGLWWAGSEERSKSVGRRAGTGRETMSHIITPKSPGVIWRDVYRWYAVVIFAGIGWREHQIETSISADTEAIDSAFAEARGHLVRVLLRTCEALLKRPGKPLRQADDIRFLLIVLDNPLLYPSEVATRMLALGRIKSQDPVNSTKPKHISTAWDSGHAYGILKRCFGLLANVPQDAHKYLVNWLARYEEDHFRRVLSLTQLFITHRLKKQHGRKRSNSVNPVDDLIPSLSGTAADTSAQLHAAIGLHNQNKPVQEPRSAHALYMEDWQIRGAARLMLSLFTANKAFRGERSISSLAADSQTDRPGSVSRDHIKNYGQLLSTTEFYNSLVELQDVIADFDLWEAGTSKFTFCQFPFLLSVGAKIRIMDHDARRQMEIKAREAFFKSIMRNKQLESYLVLKVRRECLVEDSMKNISEVVGQGQGEIKKGLKVQFVGEEGIDAGGLRKEWFLLLLREIFDPANGMFVYNDESPFCYFSPNTFEPSDQFFLVGALLGLAIYNSVILDVALPPFTFKKLLNSGVPNLRSTSQHHGPARYTLDDLAELRPSLARGLQQLLEFEGDVESAFYQDFTVQTERYGVLEIVPLCPGGESRPVTNANRQEFVDLYIKYLLDTQVVRQYEPFRRGFFTVCGGNALSLFQSEEIELLLRGSDEPLDVPSLKAVALYENWQVQGKKKGRHTDLAEGVPLIRWFWEVFHDADPKHQRRLLGFITGSDRIPAVGATSLIIKVCYGGPNSERYPIARTCFNQILLYDYPTRDDLRRKLWTAVMESEGFGLR